jgi:C1A family cysteine protease
MGSTIFAVLDFIKNYGVINESCFPYTSGIDGVEAPCSEKCENWEEQRIKAEKYRFAYGQVITKNGLSAGWDNTRVKLALVNYGPLAAPMFVFEDFLNYTGGVYELDRSKRYNLVGFHLVSIVGYQDDPSYNSGGYWICKNSWGTEWGENGYFKIKYEDFYNWMYDSITSIESWSEFFNWLFYYGFSGTFVGIGYIPSGFFKGVTTETSKSIERYEISNNTASKNSDFFNTNDFFRIAIKLISHKNKH